MTASSGFNGSFSVMQERLDQGQFSTCMRQALSQDHAVVVTDPVVGCPDCPLSPEYGGRAGMTHRLSHAGKVYGILSVSVPAAYAFDPEEQELFDELADDMGFALYKIEAEEQIRRYTHIVRTIPHPMSFVSRDYRYLAVNDVYAALYNVPKEAIVGRKVSDFLGQTVFEEEIRPHLERCLAGETVRYESRFRFPDNSLRWMGMEYHPYRDEKGRVVAVVSHGLDITEQREIEERLQKTLHATTGGVWYWHFPTNQLTFGPRYYTMLGYEPDAFAPTFENWLDLIHPEDRASALSVAEEYLRTKPDHYENEFRLRMKDGQYRWIHSWARVVERSQDGEAVLMIGNHEDITDRKQGENALRDSESKFRELVDQAPEALFLHDIKGRIVDVNKASVDRYGYSRDELLGMKTSDIDPDFVEREDDGAFWERLKEQKQIQFEARHRRKDGTIFPVKVSLSAIELSGEKFVLALADDITEIKRVVNELRESEARLEESNQVLKGVLEHTHMMAVFLDPRFNFVWVNPAYAESCRHEPSFFPGKNHFDLYPHEENRKIFQSVVDTGEPFFVAANPFEFPDQPERGVTYWDWSLIPVKDNAGDVTGLVFTLVEVTDRIRAEEALRESEERLRLAHKATRDVVWDWDIVNDTQMWNDSGAVVFGWTDIVSHPQTAGWWVEKVHPDDRDRVDKSFFSVVDNPAEDYWHDEYRFLKADGTYAHIIDRGYVLRDDQGKALRMIGAMLDISDRKQAEEALRVSEQKFRSITEQTSDVIALTDHKGIIAYVSPSCRQVFGAESEEMVGRHFPEFLDESAVPIAMESFRNAIEGGTPSRNLELLMKRKDGSLFYGELNGSFFRSRSTSGTLVLIRDVTDRKEAVDVIQKERAQLLSIFDCMPSVVDVIDPETYEVLFMNQYAKNIFGHDGVGRPCFQVFHDFDAPCEFCNNREMLAMGEEETTQWEYFNETTQRHFMTTNRLMWWPDGRKAKFELSIDVTGLKEVEDKHKKLEEQFHQAQKLESIGRLAGGVAHDFNNMLGVIIANAESAKMDIGPDQAIHKNIEEILNASHRAAETVGQLLAFARKQTISPKILDLDDMVSRALKMLRRLIGEDIVLRWMPGKDVGKVRMDPTQVHQILANLVVNSRDAMPQGGAITIGTEKKVMDASYAQKYSGLRPGDYAVLIVSDTGEGMTQDVMDQVFDPFFTTKEVGKGTGLGLPMVYGSVKQNDGFIYIDSEPGEGTTIKIYLPRREDTPAVPEKVVETKAPEGKETVLLAEDEEALLLACRTALERQGYRVLSAETPIKAMALAEKHEGEIHLLVTDVVMPEMNGRALWEGVQALHPSIKCLFMSGYTSDALGRLGVYDKGLHFIEKPFSFKQLAEKVRSVLDA